MGLKFFCILAVYKLKYIRPSITKHGTDDADKTDFYARTLFGHNFKTVMIFRPDSNTALLKLFLLRKMELGIYV